MPVFMRAARSSRNAVDVAADVFVRPFGPLQHEIEPQAVLLLEREGGSWTGLAPLSLTIFWRYASRPSVCSNVSFVFSLSSSKAIFRPLCR